VITGAAIFYGLGVIWSRNPGRALLRAPDEGVRG
jgi:hypothetical protein